MPTLLNAGKVVKPIYMAFLQIPLMIIGGGLEEIGWRGFLQPQLQKKLPVSLSTLILSVIWAIWHLPLWFIVGTHQQVNMNFFWFLINAMALSFLFAAIYYGTKSIFMCILLHAMTNAFWDVITPSYKFLPISIILVVSIAVFFLMMKCINIINNRKTAKLDNQLK